MRDRLPLKITLQIENVVAHLDDFGVLSLGDSPDEDVDLARVLREVGCDLFADECPGQIRNLQVPVDRVVVGNGDEIHAAFAKEAMEIA
jgi:hypothetical protein